jgi:hypothetical protein
MYCTENNTVITIINFGFIFQANFRCIFSLLKIWIIRINICIKCWRLVSKEFSQMLENINYISLIHIIFNFLHVLLLNMNLNGIIISKKVAKFTFLTKVLINMINVFFNRNYSTQISFTLFRYFKIFLFFNIL